MAEGVLSRIPGLAGYLSGQANDQQMQMGQLQQMGALQGILSQVEAQKAKQAAAQREGMFRSELAALGPTATQDQLAQIAAKYSPAKDILTSQTSSLDRKAALEAARINQNTQREHRLAELTQRGEQEIARVRESAAQQRITREEADRREATMRESMARLGASLRPERAPEPLQSIVGPDGKAVLVPRSQAVGQQPYTVRDTPEKALPSSLANKYLENIQNLRKADRAADLLEGKNIDGMTGDKNATGNKGLLSNLGVIGDKVLNAYDPSGVDTRAAIGDLGSMVIHERSGAAVTAAEFPRLRPFIPLVSDDPEVARKKVKRFAQEYRAEVDAQKEFFTASGYKVPQISIGGNPGASGTFPSSSQQQQSVPPPPPGFKVD